MWSLKSLTVAVGALALTCGSAATLQADEWEENTPYYEDDAWYDISEWFDGNDYNPTDEVFGNWNNEAHTRGVVDDDQDNDQWYGYNQGNENDWYYDYYDDNYVDYGYDSDVTDNTYEYSVEYYDYDNDGFYDAYTGFYDWDSDGYYEDVNFYAFSDVTANNQGQNQRSTAATQGQQQGQRQQAGQQGQQQAGQQGQQQQGQQFANQQNQRQQQGQQAGQQQQGQQQRADRSSKRLQLTGTVDQTKQVTIRSGGKHLVALLKIDNVSQPGSQTGNQATQLQNVSQMPVDLGPAEQAQQWNISSGTELTVQGAATKVGEKSILIAKQVKVGSGDMQQVDRSKTQIQGTIANLKKVTIRGKEHQLAMVNLENSDKKMAVDLGPAQALNAQLKEGDQITASGVPIKIRDRAALWAKSLQHDGQSITIQRRQESRQRPAA